MKKRSFRFWLVTWYAIWLVIVFAIAGLLLYLGLRRYLENNLLKMQRQRAQRVGVMVSNPNFTSGRKLAEEITTRFFPEASSRFIRISESDGKILYQSGEPDDRSFDPAQISPPQFPGKRKEILADGTEFVIATMAAGHSGGASLIVEAGESLSPALAELHRLLISLGLMFVLLAAMALGGGMVLIRRALGPVEEITRKAEGITSRNLSERLPVPPTGDEFEHLSQSLNRMITRLDEAFQYNRRFLADASHELRTPLTVLRGELEDFAQEKRLSPEFRDRLGSALEEVVRLASIVEGLFSMARLDAGEAQSVWNSVDLAQLVASTADQMLLLAEDKNIELACNAGKPVWVHGDRARLKQVLVNLLDNAIKYTGSKGKVLISVWTEGGSGILEISDNGIGIPAEALPHVFERFFRVDKARSRDLGGAGLGLSIVKAICTAHSGSVSVRSALGAGSLFRVELPLAESDGKIQNT